MSRTKRGAPGAPPPPRGGSGEIEDEQTAARRAAAYVDEAVGTGRIRREGQRIAIKDALADVEAVALTYAADAPEREALREVARLLLRRLKAL